MDVKMIETALAALLHDVGKLYERAGLPFDDLPHLYKYSHATATSEFFQKLNNLGWSVDIVSIEDQAAHHHINTDSVITVADRLTAAYERRETDDYFPKGKDKRPLCSLFFDVALNKENDNKNKENHWYYKTVNLSDWDDNVLPKFEDNDVSEETYQKLYGEFYERFCSLANCPQSLLVELVMDVCRSFWTFIPSSAREQEVPDITLYDHSVMTAAIACALYARSRYEKKDISDKKILLVSGDISGIQDFLLDLPNQASPGTAKLLRARSFYVTMLSRAAILLMFDRLGLPMCNCISDAGGQFTLLVHNTPETKQILNDLRIEIDRWMLEKFRGKLALIISEPVETEDQDFMNGKRYSELINRLKEQTDIAKKRKFHSALQKEGCWNLDNDSLMVMNTIPPDEQLLNKQFKKLGSRLVLEDVKFITFSRRNTATEEEFCFFDKITMSLKETNYPDQLSVLQINGSEGYRTRFDMTRHVPRLTKDDQDDIDRLNEEEQDEENIKYWRPGHVRPFNLIAKKALGVECIAVLKADVDRLGQIFSRGLEIPSISRLAVLSRLLNGFFTGFLEHKLQREKNCDGTRKYENIYTEYAGGDDLLFVGPWNTIFSLASDIHQWFTDYTCCNPDLTLSASIVMGHAKSPIASLVRTAENLLDKAKDEGRNRIGIFDKTLSWNDFDTALKDGMFLVESAENNMISDGFLYRLLQYYQMYERTEKVKKVNIHDLLWKSQLRYDMARNLTKKNEQENESLKPIRKQIDRMVTLDADVMKRLKISVTYALYLRRKSSDS
jgi:CRISPR-associated protein Csm1